MQVLVTGCHGYIGSVLVPMLEAEGHHVLGLDTDLFADCVFGPPPPERPYRLLDVRDVQRADLEGFEAVVHLAALSNDPLGNLDPSLTREINHEASVRLARLAKDAGVRRFLFSSSCSIYGASGDGLTTEQAEFNPVTPYGESKVHSDRALARLADERFSPVLLRNATAYGLSPRLRLDLVLNDLVATALVTGRVLIKSDGSPWRPLVHVEDICRAFAAVLTAPREAIHNQAFNVGRTEENYRIADVAEIVRGAVPGSRIEYAPGGGPDKRCYRVDCGKIARGLPAFRPRWNVRRGARQLAEGLRDAGLTAADLHGGRFHRLATLQKQIEDGRIGPDLRWRRTAPTTAGMSTPCSNEAAS